MSEEEEKDGGTKGTVAIVGAGQIGVQWAALFASARHPVRLFDTTRAQTERAHQAVLEKLRFLDAQGLSRSADSAEEAHKRVTIEDDLQRALHDVIWVQESTLENEDAKREIFARLDAVAPPSAIVASSTSTIPASRFTESLDYRHRCLVAHPVNPPLLLGLVEVVPAPWTAKGVVERARSILEGIGQSPVVLHKEVAGFAVNRLQYALIAEAWRLVADGVMSPRDVDAVMTEGLGPRYAFYGPFQVMHLNAPAGIRDYCQRYGAGMRRVLEDEGAIPTFDEPAVVAKLAEDLEAQTPVDALPQALATRERLIARLSRQKKEESGVGK